MLRDAAVQSSFALLARFWRDWLARRWREILVSVVLMSLLALTSAAYGEIVRRMFNALGAAPPGSMPQSAVHGLVNTNVIAGIALVLAGMTALRAVIMFAQTVATNRTVNRAGVDMQSAGYAHLLAADYDRIGRETPGHLVSRLTNDIGAVQTATVALVNTSIRDAFTVIGVVGWMLYTDWGLTLLVLGVYPLAALPILYISAVSYTHLTLPTKRIV